MLDVLLSAAAYTNGGCQCWSSTVPSSGIKIRTSFSRLTCRLAKHHDVDLSAQITVKASLLPPRLPVEAS